MPDQNDRDPARQRGRSSQFGAGATRGGSAAPIDRPTQDRLGFALRSLYDGLMDEPVPSRLTDLIRQLDRGTGH